MRRKFLDSIREVWKIPFLEKYLVSRSLGKIYGSFITKLAPNHYSYSRGTIREVDRNGIAFRLDISDLVQWYIYFGFIEVSREMLYSQIKNGDVVLDVGANIGETSLNIANIVGDKGCVHSFEPFPETFESFQHNLSLNNFSNIKVNRVGLGDTEEEVGMEIRDNSNRGMNAIKQLDDDSERKIKIVKLDSYIKENQINKVDLIKIDVEGFELRVLKGAAETLENLKPRLFIELDDNNLRDQGDSAAELIRYLKNLNYSIVNSNNNMGVFEEDEFSNCHYDIIALPA